MSILVVSGSPRKNGNTSKLVTLLSELLTDREIEHHIYKPIYGQSKPCIHCEGCRRNPNKCVVKDDTQVILDLIASRHFDTIIFASPIYFFSFSAQTKLFIDRLYSQELNDVVLGTILVSGSNFIDGGADLTIETLRRTCDYTGALWGGAFYKCTYDKKLDITDTDIYNMESLIDSLLCAKEHVQYVDTDSKLIID